MFMGILIVKLVCECFLPWQENRLNAWFLISNKNFKEKVDSMGVVEQGMTRNEFAVLRLHVMKLYYYAFILKNRPNTHKYQAVFVRFLLVLKTNLTSFSHEFLLAVTFLFYNRLWPNLVGACGWEWQFGYHGRFVTIATRAYTYDLTHFESVLTKLGWLILQMKISQRRMLLHGKLVTMATILKLGYHSNCKQMFVLWKPSRQLLLNIRYQLQNIKIVHLRCIFIKMVTMATRKYAISSLF